MSKSPTYAKIYTKIWRDEVMRAVVDLGFRHISMAFYLRTNKLQNMIGLYYLPVRQICKDLGFENEEDTLQVLEDLIQVGYCKYQKDCEYVWVIDMTPHQVERNPNEKQRKGVSNILERLLEDDAPFIDDFKKTYARYLTSEKEDSEARVVEIKKRNTGNWRGTGAHS